MTSPATPWPALAPGAVIAVIAPAGPFDRDAFTAGLARLRLHYTVRVRPDIGEQHGFLAGDDGRRRDELRDALSNPDVKAIVAVRGGYGCTRLLAELSREEVAAAGKLLVGFSDVTALHALWARAGVGSLHGPMVAALGRGDEAGYARWRAAVAGELPDSLEGLEPVAAGVAEGPLLGGNLAVLTALLGTQHMPSLRDAVLFLEDIGERPYRVDRMLTSLRDSGCLQGVAGIALGHFTDCTPSPGSEDMTVEAVLRERLGQLGVPVVAGIPAGHVDDNLPLPLGRGVRIDGAAGTLSFLD